MLKFRKISCALGVAASLGLASFAGTANAAVITWGYSVLSHFSAASYEDEPCAYCTPAGAGVTALSWGIESNAQNLQSSLVISNNPAVGSVDTWSGLNPPQAVPYLGFSNTLTHNNNVITGSSLLTAQLTAVVTLTPQNPAGSPINPATTMAFNISFSETPNSGTCAVSGSPVQCNDIFVLTGGLLNDDFDYNGDTYYVNIFPLDGVALSQLEDDACEAANVPDGCIGFSTVEGQSNSIRFGFTISTEPQQVEVPEPGMLALLGASLFGLGALRRRRLS